MADSVCMSVRATSVAPRLQMLQVEHINRSCGIAFRKWTLFFFCFLIVKQVQDRKWNPQLHRRKVGLMTIKVKFTNLWNTPLTSN